MIEQQKKLHRQECLCYRGASELVFFRSM